MPSAERTYVVPCSCSAAVAVTAGQAGARISCPRCGAAVDVPRLRDLAAFAAPTQTVAARPQGWDGSRGLVFAGVTIALLSGLVAAFAVPLGGRLVGGPPASDAIRRTVNSAPISVVHAAWTELAQSGLNRIPSPAEVRLARFTAVARGVSRVLWGVSAAATALAAVGLFTARSAPRHRGEATP
jgi:hypothetical protein